MNFCYFAFKAILIGLVTAQVHGACVLGGLSPIPDFCTMLFSAFDNLLSAEEDSSFETPLRYDKASSSWTHDCPATDECQYGIDDGDIDTCPSCLLGPGETCDSWNGKCGDKLLCQYSGPMSCSGKCVCEEEFRSREIGDKCGDWDGECKDGSKCKYHEESAFLPPMYSDFMHVHGECVTQEAFNSLGEGNLCGDKFGVCEEGLECNEPIFPWLPNVCVNETDNNITKQTDDSIMKTLFGDVSDNSNPFGGEIDIFLVEDDDADESKILSDMFKVIGNILPGLEGEIETDKDKTDGEEKDDDAVEADDDLPVDDDNDDVISEDDESEFNFDKIFDLAKMSDENKDEGEIDIGSDFEGFLKLLFSDEDEDSWDKKDDFQTL